MDKNLKILITGQLNIGKTIGDINAQLKGIEKKINKLNVRVEIDTRILTTLEKFNTQMQSMNQDLINSFINMKKVTETALMPDGTQVTREHYEGLNKTFTETVKEADKLTKSMEQTQGKTYRLNRETNFLGKSLNTTSINAKKMSNVSKDINSISDKNKTTINQEADAVDNLTASLKRNEQELKKRETNLNKHGEKKNRVDTYTDGYTETVERYDSKGAYTSGKIVENYDQQRKAIQKLEEAKEELIQKVRLLTKENKINSEEAKALTDLTKETNDIRKVDEYSRALKDLQVQQKIVNKELKDRIALQEKNGEAAKQYEQWWLKALKEQEIGLEKNKDKLHQKLAEIKREGSPTEQQFQRLTLAINSVKDTKGLDKVKTDLREVQGVLKNVGMFEQLKVAMSRIPIWMAGMTLFYAPLRGIQDIITQIIELDKQMVVLERVSNGEIDRQHILRESVELTDRLGNRISEINNGLSEFARMGFRGDGLIAMTEAATLFSNISDMNVEEASSALTSALKGFQMLPEEAMKVVDAVNEVDNSFSISSQNISSSIMKSVGAAKTFGVELSELIGYTVAIF